MVLLKVQTLSFEHIEDIGKVINLNCLIGMCGELVHLRKKCEHSEIGLFPPESNQNCCQKSIKYVLFCMQFMKISRTGQFFLITLNN